MKAVPNLPRRRRGRAKPARTTCSILAAISLVLTACAPAVVMLDPATRESLKQTPEIKVVHYGPPDLQLEGRARTGYGGSAGTAAVVASQAKLEARRELAVDDPVVRIKANVVSALSRTLTATRLTDVPTAMPDDQMQSLKGFFGKETVLDFITTYWGLAPVPFQPHDLVLYRARARLIQFPEGKVLWQGACDLEADESEGIPPGKDGALTKVLVVNNTLDRLGDRCAELLVAQFSGKPQVH